MVGALFVVLIIAVIILLFVLLGNGKNTTNTGASCTSDGVTYSNGASFKSTDGCNSCSCDNGKVACTEIACISPTGEGTNPIELVTPVTDNTPTVMVYFARPSGPTDYSTLSGVSRTTDKTGSAQVPVILNDILAGPSAAEQADGLSGIFTLTGTSTCSGSFYQYSYAGTALTVKFCKDISFIANNTGGGGSYSGMGMQAEGRVLNALEQSLKVNGTTSVIIRQSDNSCYGLDSGFNTACTD